MRYLFLVILLASACSFSEAAFIYSARGEVELKRPGSKVWERVDGDAKTKLPPGTELRTARASTAMIYLDDGSKFKVAPLSAFRMSEESADTVSIGLFVGRVRSWVKKFSKKYEVRTPSAVCAVRGTDFMMSADADGNSRVEVYEGSVLTGDSRGNSALVREGQSADIPAGGRLRDPANNPNQPNDMNSSLGDAKQIARAEIYGEISKEAVLARAQEEMQSAEYQNRKVAIDAFGNRVRMEEYTIRPADNQFKYVVLNTRGERFDFGKILFTFNDALPANLSDATANMITSPGSVAPTLYLTDMNSVMSNTLDKVTEDASGGTMQNNGSITSPAYQLVFANYKFYAAGPDEELLNGGLGKELWAFTGYNVPNFGTSICASNPGKCYTGGSILQGAGTVTTDPATYTLLPDTYRSYAKNNYSDGTWIAAEDFVLFNNGDVLSSGDFSQGLGQGNSVDAITDKLNFQRVYTSDLFDGRTINVMYSAKLLKDIGMLKVN